MKLSKLSSALLIALCANVNAATENAHITISGVIPGQVTLHQTDSTGLKSEITNKKSIKLEHIILSPEAKKYLAEHIQDHKYNLQMVNNNIAPASQIGMNNVPVLDQGMHGTCATFATTASLDAALGHTDYISQLCNLELGAYLEQQDSNYPSGWNGSTNDIILNQAKKYGIIGSTYQKLFGCAGVRNYPVYNGNNTGHLMNTDDFARHSKHIMDNLSWNTLLDMDNALSPKVQMDEVLNNVKTAIANGHRVVFGVLIDEYVGENGAAGSNKVKYDSWVLTPQIAQDAKDNIIDAGHAMVITGYDDNAIVTDENHEEHKGVLTLRNSWGLFAGDGGNYYMTYDYFTTLAMEAKEIIPSA